MPSLAPYRTWCLYVPRRTRLIERGQFQNRNQRHHEQRIVTQPSLSCLNAVGTIATYTSRSSSSTSSAAPTCDDDYTALRPSSQPTPKPSPFSSSTLTSSLLPPSNDISSSQQYSEEFWSSPSVVDVSPLADSLRQQVRQYTQKKLSETTMTTTQAAPANLRLVGLLAKSAPLDAELYSERIQHTLIDDGIDYELWRFENPAIGDDDDNSIQAFPGHHRNDELKAMIKKANAREDVDGILVFYPISPRQEELQENYKEGRPKIKRVAGVYTKTPDDYIRSLVDRGKDVEGLCGTHWYHAHRRTRQPQRQQYSPSQISSVDLLDGTSLLRQNPPSSVTTSPPLVYPPTALSVQHILEQYHPTRWQDQVISIVNRSEIWGRPLATMLSVLGATVFSIDVNSIIRFQPYGKRPPQRCTANMKLEDCLKESHVIVTGVPHPNFKIPTNSISPGSTVVNVSEFPNVCEESILHRTDMRYVPQIGKVTVAVLEQNLVQLHRFRQDQDAGSGEEKKL